MRLQARFKTLENDCFNLLIVDPNPPLDLIHFSLFLRLENTYGVSLAKKETLVREFRNLRFHSL